MQPARRQHYETHHALMMIASVWMTLSACAMGGIELRQPTVPEESRVSVFMPGIEDATERAAHHKAMIASALKRAMADRFNVYEKMQESPKSGSESPKILEAVIAQFDIIDGEVGLDGPGVPVLRNRDAKLNIQDGGVKLIRVTMHLSIKDSASGRLLCAATVTAMAAGGKVDLGASGSQLPFVGTLTLQHGGSLASVLEEKFREAAVGLFQEIDNTTRPLTVVNRDAGAQAR